MDYFNGITDQFELKLVYRRLAMLNHPDMGGDPSVMKKLNQEYTLAKQLINTESKFLSVSKNDTITVNNSPAKVIFVGEKTLIAESLKTRRRAVFCREKGVCLSNPQFKITQTKRRNHAF
jgi:hypothetical protein